MTVKDGSVRQKRRNVVDGKSKTVNCGKPHRRVLERCGAKAPRQTDIGTNNMLDGRIPVCPNCASNTEIAKAATSVT